MDSKDMINLIQKKSLTMQEDLGGKFHSGRENISYW